VSNNKNAHQKPLIQEALAMVVVDKEECTGCETCVGACPVEAISMVDGVAEIDQQECTECLTCIDECPTEAISEK